MIFDLTKHYVPEVYSESRDYRVFLKMIGMLFTVIKYNADHFPDLYTPENCPENLLPYLGDMVGYDYDSGLSIEENRIIIKYFPYLIRNRGSETGVKLATALSLNIHTDIEDLILLDDLEIQYDYVKGIIYIYYPKNAEIRKYLLEVVRPVGMTIELIPVDKVETRETLDVKVKTSIYNRDDDGTLDESQVGFSPVTGIYEEVVGEVITHNSNNKYFLAHQNIVHDSVKIFNILNQEIEVVDTLDDNIASNEHHAQEDQIAVNLLTGELTGDVADNYTANYLYYTEVNNE